MVNEHLDVGTPGVGDAVGSHGDSGKAGVSGKAVAAGVAAVAGVVAAGAAVASSGKQQEEEQPLPPQPPQPEGVRQPETVTVVEQPPADVVRDTTLTDEAHPAGYTSPSSTEGVERGVREGGDDPMIGGGSR